MATTRGKRKETNPVDEIMDKTDVISESVDEIVDKVDTTSEPMVSRRKGTVICPNLNVRKAPSLGAAIFHSIPEGTTVEILSNANETWYEVHVGKIESGFCMKEFIKEDK